MAGLESQIMEQPETLYDRLTAIGMLNRCGRSGCETSGVPRRLSEEVIQEFVISAFKKSPVNSMSNGECVNTGKIIAHRAGLKIRRTMSQPMVIPQKEFDEHERLSHQTRVDVTEDITESAMLDYGHVSMQEVDVSEDPNINGLGAQIISKIPVHRRECVDRILRQLPRAQIELVHLVVVFGESIATAADYMGVDPNSCQKYVRRIIKMIEEDQ